LFRKGETPVHEAIREALVNAVIHADYSGLGGVVVEKYRDRFEFSNPGSLLLSFEQLLRGSVSECRNKALQTMFMQIGAGEKAGSGIDKIRHGWASQHWRSPRVSEQVQPDRVQCMLPMISLIPDESLERLQQAFGKQFQQFSQLEIQALVTADLEDGVDNARMRQMTDGHATAITALLQGLVAKGALHQEGRSRWTRYRLADSVHKPDDSVHKPDDSAHKASDSVHKPADPVHGPDISAAQWAELTRIALPSRAHPRVAPAETEQLILRLCQGHWLTRRQLAELLDRNSDSIRSRFLTSLVAHGLLRLRHPDKPNRVDQAYTTASKIPTEPS